MFRIKHVSTALLFLLVLGGCKDNSTGVAEEDLGGGFTASLLQGKILRFTNPKPNTNIGEEPAWEYTFNKLRVFGCNANNRFESTGWTIIGNSIRVQFGQQFENYELRTVSGTLEGGSFSGTFHLTSSVPGNVVDGSFRQVSRTSFC